MVIFVVINFLNILFPPTPNGGGGDRSETEDDLYFAILMVWQINSWGTKTELRTCKAMK